MIVCNLELVPERVHQNGGDVRMVWMCLSLQERRRAEFLGASNYDDNGLVGELKDRDARRPPPAGM
jgi:hypothetical protein